MAEGRLHTWAVTSASDFQSLPLHRNEAGGGAGPPFAARIPS